MKLRFGDTTVEVTLTREPAPAPVEPAQEMRPVVHGFELQAPLAFGAMFVLFKRSLWPLVLLHGLTDTLTFTAIFMKWK